MTQTKIKFYSAWYCPFAQRTWTALEHLALPYDYMEIDPYDKTAHWLKVSRGAGQVPVLEVRHPDEATMYIPDSVRTLEYLGDISGSDSRLWPSTPSARAEARFWLDHQGRAIIPYFYRFLKAERGSPSESEARDQMLAGLRALAEAMTPEGTYFWGDRPGMIDLAFAPFALRIESLLSHYSAFRLPQSGGAWARYATWWRAMKSYAPFTRTMPNRDTYDARLLEFYLPYSQGRGQQDVTEAN